MLVPILLLGESGTGKSRLARYIHDWSGRSGKYITVDCAGLTDDMFTLELFGRPVGNGLRSREGAIRRARSGTLFLENVHHLTSTHQNLLLRVLAPIGETKVNLPATTPYPSCTSRLRIVASADLPLLDEISAGRFRPDLYYRLAGVSATLPSVREYSHDERHQLLLSFLITLQQKLSMRWNFSGDAWQTLMDEQWPGNLREVSRILQQICLISAPEVTITRESVLQQLRQGRVTMATRPAVQPAQASGSSLYHGEDVSAPMPDIAYSSSILDSDEPEEEEEESYEDSWKEAEENESPARDFFTLGSSESINDALNRLLMEKVGEAMEMSNGNKSEAARLLGITGSQLTTALKKIRAMQSDEDDE